MKTFADAINEAFCDASDLRDQLREALALAPPEHRLRIETLLSHAVVIANQTWDMVPAETAPPLTPDEEAMLREPSPL